MKEAHDGGGKKSTQIGVRLDPNQRAKIENAAARDGRSPSGWIRHVALTSAEGFAHAVTEPAGTYRGEELHALQVLIEVREKSGALADALLALGEAAIRRERLARVVTDLAAELLEPQPARTSERSPRRRAPGGKGEPSP